MDLKPVYVSWVDLFVVIIVLWGVRQGRRNGMSQEVLFVLQWLCIVVIAGMAYEPLGMFLAQTGLFSLLFSYVAVYVLLALAIKIFFSWLRRAVGEKLVQADVFGSGEYYCGMLAGAFRYALILLVTLSLLNARYFNDREVAAYRRYQEVNFNNIFFPSLADVQNEVFDRSLAGGVALDYLSIVLIRPTAAEDTPLNKAGVVRAREQQIDEMLERR